MLNWPKPGWLIECVVISDFAIASSAAASSASSCASGGMASRNRLEGTRIVAPETILGDEQLKMEEKSKKNIAEGVHDKESALQFLARRKVIPNEIECKKCERQASILLLPLQPVESDVMFVSVLDVPAFGVCEVERISSTYKQVCRIFSSRSFRYLT